MNNNASHTLLFENDIIKDVNFMPSPVIAKTPIIKEAHKIIEAIKEICLPHKLQAFLNLSNPTLISNFVFRLKNNSTNDNKIAIEAENCGVKPLNIKNNKIKVSKLGQGLPVGGEIEQLDDGTLFSAFKNRVPVSSD